MLYELSSSLPLLALYKDNEWFLLTTQDLTFNVIRILLTIFIRVQRLRVTPYYFPCRSEVSFSIILDITRGSQNSIKNSGFKSHPKNCWLGPTETGTQIAGFRVQSANHYKMEPYARKRKSVKSIYRPQRQTVISSTEFIRYNEKCFMLSLEQRRVVSLNSRWTYYKKFKKEKKCMC